MPSPSPPTTTAVPSFLDPRPLFSEATFADGALFDRVTFAGWTKTFTEPRLCAAIVDRLTFNAAIIDTGTRSYRLAQTEAQHSIHG